MALCTKFLYNATIYNDADMTHSKNYIWTIIGAGPAGIATIGQLLDNGVNPDDILWIDPYFKVGDLGRLWSNVSSNTTAKLFTAFLQSCKSFNYDDNRHKFDLDKLNPEHTCDLKYMAQPLQWITEQLQRLITTVVAHITHIERINGYWHLKPAGEGSFISKNVVLCTGAKPKTLSIEHPDIINFELAIDKQQFEAIFDSQATYGVFGSSHSAIMILRHLIELGAKKIINFYQSPCCYAIPVGAEILFDNTGLKGETAIWAAQYIDGRIPENLTRIMSNHDNIEKLLPTIDKLIFAVGFEPNHELSIANIDLTKYNPHTGIIAPGLFGLGIAYPQLKTDSLGNQEWQVGIWKFMNYLKQIMPYWLKYNEIFK